MSSVKGVGFDMARSETPCGLTQATQLEFFESISTGGLSLIFPLLLSSAAFYRLSCLCCCGGNMRSTLRRPGLEADCRVLWDLVPCFKRPASAGHLVLHFVTGLMVGDRRFPKATILGASWKTPSANHPVSVPPTGSELRDSLLCGHCTKWQVQHILTRVALPQVP